MQAPGFSAQRYGFHQIRTPRDIEYDALSRVTHQLQRAIGGDGSLAAAAAANSDLWTTFATDLADDGNALPARLRGTLVSLAIFSIRHGQKVMAGERDA